MFFATTPTMLQRESVVTYHPTDILPVQPPDTFYQAQNVSAKRHTLLRCSDHIYDMATVVTFLQWQTNRTFCSISMLNYLQHLIKPVSLLMMQPCDPKVDPLHPSLHVTASTRCGCARHWGACNIEEHEIISRPVITLANPVPQLVILRMAKPLTQPASSRSYCATRVVTLCDCQWLSGSFGTVYSRWATCKTPSIRWCLKRSFYMLQLVVQRHSVRSLFGTHVNFV